MSTSTKANVTGAMMNDEAVLSPIAKLKILLATQLVAQNYYTVNM